MKKLIIVSLALMLSGSAVFAQGLQVGQQVQEVSQQQRQISAEKINEVKASIQQVQQAVREEVKDLLGTEKEIFQNQNEVRAAAHSLLEMKDIVGGIGQQLSEIAKEFDNSVQATIKAEERIQTRNQVLRFFAGGDQEAAQIMQREVNRNMERVEQIKQLREECDCDEEVREMIQEQVRNMEEEQNRLQQLIQKERQDRGIFGWFFGWLQR